VTSLSASNILAAFWALGSTVWFNKALCDILIPNWQCQTKVLHCWPRNLDSLPSSRWCIFHSIHFFFNFFPVFCIMYFLPHSFYVVKRTMLCWLGPIYHTACPNRFKLSHRLSWEQQQQQWAVKWGGGAEQLILNTVSQFLWHY